MTDNELTRNQRGTTWGSRNAEDLFRIATRIAGFDARELMLEIHKRTRHTTEKVNERTVLAAMQSIHTKRKAVCV